MMVLGLVHLCSKATGKTIGDIVGDALRHHLAAPDQSKEDFELEFAAKFPGVQWGKTHHALYCTCRDGGGPTRWAAIQNTPGEMRKHRELEEA